MKPTEAGNRLYALSHSLLDDAARVKRIMDELGKDRHTIRIGIPPMLGAILLPKLMKGFFAVRPEIRPEILESNREDLLKKVDDGMIDFAFIVHQDPPAGAYDSLFLANPEIGCVVHPADSLATKKQLSVQDLQGHKVVMFTDAFFHAMRLRQSFAAAGVEPDILFQTSQLSTMLEIVKNNIAAGFLFQGISGQFPQLQYIPFVEPLHVKVSLLWKHNGAHFKEMDSFLHFMKAGMASGLEASHTHDGFFPSSPVK